MVVFIKPCICSLFIISSISFTRSSIGCSAISLALTPLMSAMSSVSSFSYSPINSITAFIITIPLACASIVLSLPTFINSSISIFFPILANANKCFPLISINKHSLYNYIFLLESVLFFFWWRFW
ncbi:hypothetical protein CTC_01548 [Clostridium tetani E88]|uniref:Uncharacterized protein n=1 Tax=Clostridium tetani (strain Massachusetts / E88) TaxID=212717 RepID=Q894J5_CLOTE|nr:hypothetical protein CTC_01548 [Clostridium tetani E88]